MKYTIGRKVNMSQVFAENGTVTPVTVIKLEPLSVTQVKTTAKDGYAAVQVGYGVQKESRIKRPQRVAPRSPSGEVGKSQFFRGFKEVRGIGEIEAITAGDTIQVSGISKGRGFQGVVKRHGFHGGRRTHGQKHSEREPGSIGATGPQRVFKGTRMGGRMGSDRINVKGLKIIQIDKENNQIAENGPVPGRRGTIVEIQNAN